MLGPLAGNDAGGGEAEFQLAQFETAGPRRFFEIGPEPGIGDRLAFCACGAHHGQMVERLFRTRRAVIHGMIVGE